VFELAAQNLVYSVDHNLAELWRRTVSRADQYLHKVENEVGWEKGERANQRCDVVEDANDCGEQRNRRSNVCPDRSDYNFQEKIGKVAPLCVLFVFFCKRRSSINVNKGYRFEKAFMRIKEKQAS
jgi:hypothetical protein